MAKLHCHLPIQSNHVHLSQLYTGLSILRRQGRISLSVDVADSCASLVGSASALHPSAITLQVDGKTVVFDVSDAANLNQRMLSEADLYFKRSYYPLVVEAVGAASYKVRPYGLNYWVLPDFVDVFSLRRALAFYRGGKRLKQIVRTLDVENRLQYNPRLRDLEAPPTPGQEPRILFLARTWDPEKQGHFQLTEARQADRHAINETRAGCIRALRRNFGSRFTGGLVPTAHAKANYADCVVGQEGITAKQHYLQMVKRHTICIATTGLNGSIGWKFGEYVALSRAIVSEPLCCELPGHFMQGRNFSAFKTVEECLEQIGALMDSPEKCTEMMGANYDYYKAALRPDQLVLNCLEQVLTFDAAGSRA